MESPPLLVGFLLIFLLFSWLYFHLSHCSLRYYAAKYRVSQHGREEFLSGLDKSSARVYKPALLGTKYYDQKEQEKLGEKEYFQHLAASANLERFVLGGILFNFLVAGFIGLCRVTTQQDSARTSILSIQYIVVALVAALVLIRGMRFGYNIRDLEATHQRPTSGS